MVSRQLQKQCDIHNESMRRVKVFNRFPLSNVLKANGNILISGGDEEHRADCVASLVQQTVYSHPYLSVIVLSNNEWTEQRLISMANTGELGRLFVSSSDYKNYDVFYGMSSIVIADCFSRIAEARKYRDSSEIHDYAIAFLKVLNQANDGDVSLKAIKEFSKSSDDVIAKYAKNHGMNTEYTQIVGSKAGGKSFRSILEVLDNAFAGITTPECETRYNIVNAISMSSVSYIRLDSDDMQIAAIYFSCVLNQLVGNGRSFVIIYDDSMLLQYAEFAQTMCSIKRKPCVLVGVSIENAASVEYDNFLSNFPRFILLLDSSVDPADMQKMLNSLGEYTHFEPAESTGTPPRLLFILERSSSENIIQYTRPKVLMEETNRFVAVVRGYNGVEICLAHRLGG